VTGGAGIVSGELVPISVPPQEPVNHWSVPPEPPEAVRVMLLPAPEQTDGGIAEAEVGATGDEHVTNTENASWPLESLLLELASATFKITPR
jgi:hypothetical protein